jgi:hypothetical protein
MSTPHTPVTPPAGQPSGDPLANKQQAWSALFSEPMSELVQRYTASVSFDKRLWQADIAGSLAHADMLAAQAIISGSRASDAAAVLDSTGTSGGDLSARAAGPARAGLFMNLTPFFAALLSAAFLGEAPQAFHAAAFVLIVAGIVLSARR